MNYWATNQQEKGHHSLMNEFVLITSSHFTLPHFSIEIYWFCVLMLAASHNTTSTEVGTVGEESCLPSKAVV